MHAAIHNLMQCNALNAYACACVCFLCASVCANWYIHTVCARVGGGGVFFACEHSCI